MIEMNYQDNKPIIESCYNSLGLADEFEKDNVYLGSAFHEIKNIWIENFERNDKVKFLLIAEAPLWGQNKEYIYNPKSNNTQVFLQE